MSRTRSLVTICRFGGEHGWGHVTRSSALNICALAMGWETELCTTSDLSALPHEQRGAFSKLTKYTDLDLDTILGERDSLDVVLIDEMYQLDSFYEKARSIIDKFQGARLVAMDDMKTRSLGAAHLVINTELGLLEANYSSEKSILGEKYALVRNAFSDSSAIEWPVPPGLVRVLIMIGGTDPFGWTEKVLDSLRQLKGVQFAPIVVSGDGKNEKSVAESLARFSISRYETGLSSGELAGWISSCQFGIIACGSSLYELASLGCQFIGICVADNQLRTAKKIKENWDLPIVFTDSNRDINGDLDRALRSILEQLDQTNGSRYSEVDCLGPRRVMEKIERL